MLLLLLGVLVEPGHCLLKLTLFHTVGATVNSIKAFEPLPNSVCIALLRLRYHIRVSQRYWLEPWAKLPWIKTPQTKRKHKSKITAKTKSLNKSNNWMILQFLLPDTTQGKETCICHTSFILLFVLLLWVWKLGLEGVDPWWRKFRSADLWCLFCVDQTVVFC